ncbi:MAG: regulatory protein RecX [Rubrobacter sp.]|nr:regulatory protein RecX [Rubrobacter sp.]
MPEITGLRERRGRVWVSVDGEPFAEIASEVMLDRGLYEGLSISEEELDGVRVAGERSLAMTRAFDYLAYRARSAGEVRGRLYRYGYGDRTIEEVLARLEELGYVDDREFARTVARERGGKYGPRRVYSDLLKGGVSEELADAAVEEEFSGRSEVEEARSAALRRYNTGQGSDAESRRVYGFLARRGYSAGVCAEIAREFRVDGDLRASEEADT